MNKLEVDLDRLKWIMNLEGDHTSDNGSEPDYGGPKCSECGITKIFDWSELKADGEDEKSEGGDDQSEKSYESLLQHVYMFILVSSCILPLLYITHLKAYNS